jgi:hypothetical protein
MAQLKKLKQLLKLQTAIQVPKRANHIQVAIIHLLLQVCLKPLNTQIALR